MYIYIYICIYKPEVQESMVAILVSVGVIK